MRYIKRIWAKRFFVKKRRTAARQIRQLWRPTPLSKQEKQSSGKLYDYFLAREGSGVHKWHHYFDIYERHVGKYVGTPVRFLEIGVFRGGSLRMWRDYLGPDATIVGIDVNPESAKYDGQCGAVRIGDQADEKFLQAVCDEFGPFDVVLDDGGHYPSQQIASFCLLYPQIRENGVFISEDTHTNFWPKRQDLGSRNTFVNLASQIAMRLSEPMYRAKNLSGYARPPMQRSGDVYVSHVAATTFSVLFYDSVIVFEKRLKAEPRHEVR